MLKVLVCALALGVVTHAQIGGVVTDSSGSSVPDAEVGLSQAGKRPRSSRTGADGAFRFDNVLPGEYLLLVSKPGFTEASASVKLQPGNDLRVPMVLAVAAVQNQMTVTADADPLTSDSSKIALSLDQMDALPAFDNDVAGLLTRSLDPTASAGGATVVIDGVEQPLSRVPASIIESARIVSDGYSAEFTRPGRGRLEIRTKPGTNDFHGSLAMILRDARFAARNAFATARPNGNQKVFEASISGPLLKDRTSFVVSVEAGTDRRQTLLVARAPGGDVREWITTPEDELDFSGRLTHSLNARHSFSAGIEHSRGTALSGVGGFRLPEAATDEIERENELQLGWQAAFSSSVLNLFSVRLEQESETVLARQGGPQVVVQGAFTGGGAAQNSDSKSLDLRVSNVLSVVRGNHNIQMGAQISQFDWNRLRNEDRFAGVWTFASLDDYAAGRPLFYEVRQGVPDLQFWRGVAGAFVQDEWRVRPNLQLGLGLRTEWHSAPAGFRFAPRLSAAWAVGKNTRIRAGAGVFLEPAAVQLSPDVRQFDGTRLRDVLVAVPPYPDPFLGGESGATRPPNVIRFADDIRTPYLFQTSLGVEHSLSSSVTGSARVVTSRGIGLFRSRDANAPLIAGASRPDAQLGVLRTIESGSRRSATALELMLRGRLAKFLSGSVGYDLAFAKDDTGGAGWFPANSLSPQGEWSRSDFDRRHTVRAMVVAQVPSMADIGFVLNAQSGAPYTITTGSDDNGDGRTNDRPAGIVRNTGQSPGAFDFDVRLSREFKTGPDGSYRIRLSCDAFNITNRVNRGAIVGNLRSPFYGQSVSAGDPRRMQFGVRVRF